MVVFWYAVMNGFEYSPEKGNRIVEWWTHRGWVTEALEIQNYNALYADLGLKVRYNDRWDLSTYVCEPDEFEHLCWVRGGTKHFTAGNGRGIVTYDPMGRSKTVAEGRLESKRIMRMQGSI